MKPTTVVVAIGIAFAASLLPSLIHPWGDLRGGAGSIAPLMEGSQMPPEVRQVFEQKCADCHSNKTHWPVYSRVAPVSWLIEKDVHEGREHLNISKWPQYSPSRQIDLLTSIASEARAGQMPVKQYLVFHPRARLSPEEQQFVYRWAKEERKRISRQSAGQPEPLQSQRGAQAR